MSAARRSSTGRGAAANRPVASSWAASPASTAVRTLDFRSIAASAGYAARPATAGATARATIAVSSPSSAMTGGAISAPSAIEPRITAQKTPKTRAVTSGATARWSAVIATTSTISVAAPRMTCAATATAGDSLIASTMLGRQ